MKTCIISNGHGFYQRPGKRSPILPFDHPLKEEIMKADKQTGPGWRYPEWYGNKKIVQYIIQMLPKDKVRAINLVPDSERYAQFLSGRVARANQMKADLYLAIHSDAFGMGDTFNTANGFSTFYHSAKEEAEIFNKNMALMFPDRRNRGVVWNNSFHELMGPKMKSVLTESFFYTNEEEVLFLLNNLEQIGQAHVNALIEWSQL